MISIVELRPVVDKIPPVLRPLLLLVLPVILLHTIFMRTPSGPPPPSLNSANGPSPQDARTLIEQTEVFRAKKTASFPARGRLEDLQQYPLFRAMRTAGYLSNESLQWNGSSEIRPEANLDARTVLAADLEDDGRTIDVVVARKVFERVAGIYGPPQALPPPLQHSTRVDFTWRWSQTNRVAAFLDFLPATGQLSGTAYFLREPNMEWKLMQIDVNDVSPDLTTPR